MMGDSMIYQSLYNTSFIILKNMLKTQLARLYCQNMIKM